MFRIVLAGSLFTKLPSTTMLMWLYISLIKVHFLMILGSQLTIPLLFLRRL
ncbi:unnamed protein product [Protopolystoma xenopodis]|uniref:Uncharacterized protein n=1 Tax=Protopolystoma xenopodis TaxID=117903 RepID=A0A3S5ANS1_9PLAT|nr:unnamed protein product [Protopolystoma xenopodis]